MSVYALHQAIQYQITEIRTREWRWSFTPPTGPGRSGHVVGEFEWAVTVVRRAIDVWHLMNRRADSEAA